MQDYQNNMVGSMKFTMNRIRASCVKTIRYFSRSYDINVISGWRCAHTGSCKNQKCSSIKMNDTIMELETEGNSYPSITRCMETERVGKWMFLHRSCLFVL